MLRKERQEEKQLSQYWRLHTFSFSYYFYQKDKRAKPGNFLTNWCSFSFPQYKCAPHFPLLLLLLPFPFISSLPLLILPFPLSYPSYSSSLHPSASVVTSRQRQCNTASAQFSVSRTFRFTAISAYQKFCIYKISLYFRLVKTPRSQFGLSQSVLRLGYGQDGPGFESRQG
jgi:hypothetical protein